MKQFPATDVEKISVAKRTLLIDPAWTKGYRCSRRIFDASNVQCRSTNSAGYGSCPFRIESTAARAEPSVVHGTADQPAPLDLTGRPTAELIPRAELQVYPEAPHGVFMTHIERLNADLLRFARA